MGCISSAKNKMSRSYLLCAMASLIVTPSITRANWAESAFPVKTYDFGTVAVASKTEFRFPITNTTNDTIHIQTVRASCGCTTPIVETDYIAPHADCTIGMVEDARIAVVNLAPEGKTRRFVLHPKSHRHDVAHRIEIDLVHGTLIVMGGKTQDDFRHGVPKCFGASNRISLSFRQFA